MVTTRKERQSNRRLLTQLDDFDEDLNIGNTMSDRNENTTVNESTAEREFTVGNSDGVPAINEDVVKVKTWDKNFNEIIDREMLNNVDTVKEKIQNAILTAIDSILLLKFNYLLSQ